MKIDRRQFLKIMGWSSAGAAMAGCDLPSTIALQQGEEEITSYVLPEEWVIPGIGVYYASTCPQCAAGCGMYGRIREGRILKAEGNPLSPVNQGKLCQMGQSGPQSHYNPDRLTKPLLRRGGELTPVSWKEAWSALNDKLGGSAAGDRTAWVTGSISGHQAVLLDAHLASLGSKHHFVHEVVGDPVWAGVNNAVLGEAYPHYRIDKARLVLSFGADLMGASISPVHYSRMYQEFRTGDRGMLIAVEPKMTLTGANADLWLPVRPGTEGTMAMGLVYLLIDKYGVSKDTVPAALLGRLDHYTPGKVQEATGVPMKYLEQVAQALAERRPSAVVAGTAAQGQSHGYDAASAAMLLNIMLGNVNKTIVSSGGFPFPQLQPKVAGTRDVVAFADGLRHKQFDTVLFYNANPVFTSPKALGVEENLKNAPFKVAFTWFGDETAMRSDLVIPLAFPYEAWGTHVPAYQPHEHGLISMQQPLMNPLYEGTQGIGDVLLTMLKARSVKEYQGFKDYYSYLRNAFVALPADVKEGLSDEDFWNQALQRGLLQVKTSPPPLKVNAAALSFNLPEYASVPDYPYTVIPSARLGMWDGRHANIPWLQEAPDQIAKVVWGSWAELHPSTAAKIGVKTGDVIRVESQFGSTETPVYVYKGMHPDAVGLPLGQGHEDYGRYAKGRGINPMDILGPERDATTGELALFGTRVKISRSEAPIKLVKFKGSDTQMGRRMVQTITAAQYRETEGGDTNVS